VAHTCNPSYSGGRDQEDHSLKRGWANSLRDPISKIPNTIPVLPKRKIIKKFKKIRESRGQRF
jgi:hypothetical protein